MEGGTRMNRRISYGIIGGLVFLFMGALIGFFLGRYIGGNYYPESVLWNWQGYEAGGWVGIITGGLLGGVLGYNLGARMASR